MTKSESEEIRRQKNDNQTILLEIDDVEVTFDPSSSAFDAFRNRFFGSNKSKIRAVDGVSIELKENQILGVIGESGCGKSTLLKAVMGLHQPTSGDIVFNNEPTSEFTDKEWNEYRKRVQIIFQDPFDSLDPKFTVEESLKEPLSIHNIDHDQQLIRETLKRVELSPPEQYLDRLPSQLSGGELQRVSIARALILEPDIILADEPVSMLDVSTQARILELLNDLTEDIGASMLYISHDLSTVSYLCDQINVMYLGRIVEKAPTRKLLEDPKHPYSRALLKAVPVPDPLQKRERTTLDGEVGDPTNIPSGCRFKDRCPESMKICDERPLSLPINETDRHWVACHLHYDHDNKISGSNQKDMPVETNGGVYHE